MPDLTFRPGQIDVATLPRRMAHALHALLECEREGTGLPTAAEVVIYDVEALSAKSTAAALREAANRGYCMYVPPGHWTPWLGLGDYRTELEERFLMETDVLHA